MGHGIFKQTNGAFVVTVHSPGGIFNAQQLAKITELTAQGVGIAKITTRQTFGIVTTEEKIPLVRQGLESVGLGMSTFGEQVRNIKACPGLLCRFALQDALRLAQELEARYGKMSTPRDLKIGVAGCLRSCVECFCQDIGLMGTPEGYHVIIGGKGAGLRPVHGSLIQEKVTEEKVVPLVGRIIELYQSEAKYRERLCKTIERIGIAPFKRLCDPSS